MEQMKKTGTNITKIKSTKIKSFDLDENVYEEIISILAKNGRPDLISELRSSKDDDYKPTKKEKKIKEYYEYCDAIDLGVEESYSSSDVLVDKDGFFSLK